MEGDFVANFMVNRNPTYKLVLCDFIGSWWVVGSECGHVFMIDIGLLFMFRGIYCQTSIRYIMKPYENYNGKF